MRLTSVVFCGLVWLLLPGAVLGQDVLELDHATGLVSFGGKTLRSGDTIRFESASDFTVNVSSTSTAGYVVSITSEPAAPPELASIQSFGEAAGRFIPLVLDEALSDDDPVLPLVPSRTPPTSPICTVSLTDADLVSLLGAEVTIRTRTGEVLAGLDDLAATERGLDAVVASLQGQTGSTVGAGTAARKGILDDHFDEVTTPRPHLTHKQRVRLPASLVGLGAAQRVAGAALASLGAANPSQVGCLNGVFTAVLNSTNAYDDAAKAVRKITVLEATASPLWNARGTWNTADPAAEARLPTLSGRRGAKITVLVKRSADARLQALAVLPDQSVTITILPQWSVAPVLGVALVHSPASTFTTFGTRATGNGSEALGFANGSTNARLTYGVTLGLVIRALDARGSRAGLALWPEVFVTPTDGVSSLGGGLAVTVLRYLKVGGGRMWTRHSILDGQSEGDLLPYPEALRTRSTFGDSEWYVSFAISGWEPFK